MSKSGLARWLGGNAHPDPPEILHWVSYLFKTSHLFANLQHRVLSFLYFCL